MIRQVDRFVKMTQEVLDFSRGISEMTIERANLGSVLEGALKFIKADFTKGNIALVQNFEYSGECSLDVEKIHRAVYNIASNAVDAMPDGGSLTVHTQKVDDRVEIEFTDTGKGIPDEVKPRVLEPFFTFGKKHGTGLGLAIVKKIVEDHHGTIAITSKPGQGTTICLSLPLTM
jgi:signal transduction histidine kinase